MTISSVITILIIHIVCIIFSILVNIITTIIIRSKFGPSARDSLQDHLANHATRTMSAPVTFVTSADRAAGGTPPGAASLQPAASGHDQAGLQPAATGHHQASPQPTATDHGATTNLHPAAPGHDPPHRPPRPEALGRRAGELGVRAGA